MTMTAITYIPGMLLGYSIIRAGWLDGFDLHASGKLDAVLGQALGPDRRPRRGTPAGLGAVPGRGSA